MTQRTLGSSTYVFGPFSGNRLGVAHDSLGNVLAYGQDVFNYDRMSQLVSFSSSLSGVNEQYLYDGAGEKLARIGAVSSLSIVSTSLPFGSSGTGYSAQLQGSGGTTPYTWTLLSGALPAGLQLYPNGTISGTPTESGIYVFTVRLQEAAGASATAQFVLKVQAGTDFFTVTPCRVYDSYDVTPGGLTAASFPKTIQVAGLCNVPSTAMAVAVNATAAGPTADALFTLYPAGVPLPAATIVAAKAGGVRAGFGILAISGPSRGALSLWANLTGTNTTRFVLDVSGYFRAPSISGSRTDAGTAEVAGLTRPASDNQFAPTTVQGTRTFIYRNGDRRPSTEYAGDSLQKDYFYLGSLLAATWEPSAGWKYYSSDHLGTPRLVTNALGQTLEKPKYRPFGDVLDSGGTTPKGLGFAMMEAGDLGSSARHYDDHARHMGAWMGRFLGPDRLSGNVEDPQSWNRYTYARNNPLKYVDPDGRATKLAEAVAGTIEQAGAVVSRGGAAVNNGTVMGIALDAVLGTTGAIVGGMGDMFRVGDSIGGALGSGASEGEFAEAVRQDFVRGASLFAAMAVPANAGIKALAPSYAFGSGSLGAAEARTLQSGGLNRPGNSGDWLS